MSAPESPQRPLGRMRLAGAGVELAAAVGGACLLGYWIDKHYDTSPWGILVCSVLGVVGGLYNLIREAVHETLIPDRKDKQSGTPDDEAGP